MFAPYLNTLGGGERVIVQVAETLQENHNVTLCSPRSVDARWTTLGFPDVPITVCNARRFMRWTLRADLSVSLTNHAPLPSFARRAVLIVQFPTDDLRSLGRLRRMARRLALARYTVATYSHFNARILEERWGIRDVVVLPPPVRQYPYEPLAKAPVILSVGRFGTAGGHKRHDMLLEAWAMVRGRIPGWELVLAGAGSADDENVQRLQTVADQIGGVSILVDAPPDVLGNLYRTASIYWHATGYGRDSSRPDLAEHFGMSTVEAMSAGAVPIVFRDGGQVEIVDGTGGVFWDDLDGLVAATCAFVDDPQLLRETGIRVSAAARRYDEDVFISAVRSFQ